MSQTMNTGAQHEPTERMLKPMKLRTYKSAFEGQEPLTALNIPGKTVDGRNWTSYIEDAKGVEVLQVSGGSYEEASSIAGSILHAVNNHDALVEALEFALRESGCDGDLCNYRWHEKARAALAAAQE